MFLKTFCKQLYDIKYSNLIHITYTHGFENSSMLHADRTNTSTTILDQSGPILDQSEGVFHIPQNNLI